MAKSGRRVLIVEDEGLIRMLLAEDLTDEGFEVLEAATGDEAVALIDDPDNLDLVVTDIQMPGATDGNVVAAVAKAKNPGMPVIYMTGNPHSLRNAIGARDVLIRKPATPSEITRVVTRLLKAS